MLRNDVEIWGHRGMIEIERGAVGAILDRFVEGLFRLMLDHHRAQVVEMDLTVVQAQTLTLLRGEPLPATRLASSLGISAPAMTQLTDRLVRKHLIERRSAARDRRTVIIELTTQGRHVVDRFRKRRSEVFGEALSRLEDPDREEVIDALSKIVVVLEGPAPRAIRAHEPIRSEHLEKRTPAEPAEASKKGGEIAASPPVRRMRIEWD
jgi:DNA-binding MarR family transcriptional regulator